MIRAQDGDRGPTTPDAGGRRTPAFYAVLFIGLGLLQLLCYARSFDVRPAADDWFAPLPEIQRGDREGVGAFFLRSGQFVNYRPLQSVAIWAVGQAPKADRYVAIRLLHFGCMWAYMAAVFLWLSALPIGRAATAIGGLALVLHPVLVAPLASIDGFSSLASSAALWLGAWCVLRWAGRPAVAAVLALACFVVGAGFKEYAFGLIPLCGLTALCFGGRGRWRLAITVCLPLCLAMAGLLVVRRATIPPGASAGFAYISLGPRHLLANAGLLAAGLLFPGNSVWIYLHRTPAVLAACAAAVLGVVAVIAGGIWHWAARARARDAAAAGDAGAALAAGSAAAADWPAVARAAHPGQWLGFLLLSLVAASFPANIIFHMSEMYVAPLVAPFALFCGLAAEGWLTRRSRRAGAPGPVGRRWMGPAAACAACGAAVAATSAVIQKVEGVRGVGLRADSMMRQVVGQFPAGTRDKRLAVLFLESQLPPDRSYSVYRLGDDVLVPDFNVALDYYRPGLGWRVDTATVKRVGDFQPAGYDVVLVWDAPTGLFQPLAPSTAAPAGTP